MDKPNYKQDSNKIITIIILMGLILSLVLILNYKSVNISYIANLPTDDIDNALITINLPHHEIHEGEHFTLSNYIILGGSASYGWLFLPTGDEEIHLVISAENSVHANYTFIENPIITNNGTSMTYFNRNRLFPDTNVLKIFKQPVFSGGLNLISKDAGDGKKVGGSNRDSNEIILNPNKTYIIYVENLAVSDNTINYIFDWYTH